MQPVTVPYEELCKISGESEPCKVRGWLIDNDVKHFVGKFNRPATTTIALNAALGFEYGQPSVEQKTELTV